jgi:hypothetical protein
MFVNLPLKLEKLVPKALSAQLTTFALEMNLSAQPSLLKVPNVLPLLIVNLD